MWRMRGISESTAPNTIFLRRLDSENRSFVHQCDRNVTAYLLRDNEPGKKRKTPLRWPRVGPRQDDVTNSPLKSLHFRGEVK